MRLEDYPDDEEASDLTPKQTEVLGFIADCIEYQRLPPTRAEIAKHFGYRSLNAAQEIVQRLAAKGCLVLIDGSPRGIRLPDRC